MTAGFVILLVCTILAIAIWGDSSNSLKLYDSFGDVAFCLVLWLIKCCIAVILSRVMIEPYWNQQREKAS